MADIGPVMRGSVVKLGTKCGNPKCKCAHGDKHVQYYFSLSTTASLSGKRIMC
jgi:hypothetical protein